MKPRKGTVGPDVKSLEIFFVFVIGFLVWSFGFPDVLLCVCVFGVLETCQCRSGGGRASIHTYIYIYVYTYIYIYIQIYIYIYIYSNAAT